MSPDWKSVLLGDYSQIILGGTPKTKESAYWNGDIPWTSIVDFDVRKYLYKTEKTITKRGLSESNTKLLEVGDIIISARGTVGKTVVCGVPMAFNQSCYALRSKSEKLDQYFLYYMINYYVIQLQKKATGGVFDTIVTDTLKNLEIKLPPLSIQRKIAGILSAYDDLIENNTRRIQIQEEMAKRIYSEWFVHFRYPGHENDKLVESELGMIPEGWGVKRVDEVATIYRGRSYKSSELKAGLPFVNLKNIKRNGGYRHEGIKQYSGAFKDTQIAHPDDVIIAVTDMTPDRGIIARAAKVPNMGIEMFVFSMDLVKPVPDEGIDKEYLLGMFLYSTYADEVKEYANGVNVLHLSPERIAEYKFAFPTQSLRRRYAEIVDPIYSWIDNMHLKNQSLRKTLDLLLPRLISGKTDIAELDIDIGG